MYAKILQRLLQRFYVVEGRAPVSAAEWSELRRQAMELARKEGGDPITGTPFPGWNPKVIEGGKSKKGIEGLMKSGDLTRGTAPKTLKSTLQRKKEGLEGQINKEMWQKQKRQENKDAIRRFKEKNPRTVEDFRDKGDWDPSGMAQGGIAPLVGEPSYAADFYDDRTLMAKGKKAKKKKKKALPEELPPYQGPEYETNNPNEAAKEIIRQIIGEGIISSPITGGLDYGVGYGEDRPFDYGIGYNMGEGDSGLYADYGIRGDGENVYTGGYKGDNWDIGVRKEEGGDPTFGFNWKKKFNQGGRIEMGAGGITKLLKGFLKKKPKPKSNRLSEQDVADLKKKHGLDPESLKKDDEAFNLRLQQILAKHSTKHAEGGRIGMAGGGALFKFIEKLFIKASNDIRQGRGKWKGLDQKQMVIQHDNLTKKVVEFEKTGNTVGLEEYFGVDPHTAFIAARDKAKRLGIKKDFSKAEIDAQRQEQILDEAAQGGVDMLDERGMLKQKYPGISDDLVEKILIDDNPQRKADVMGTIDDYMKLREVGKSEAEAYDIITKSFSKNPTKHAEGGRIGFNPGGPVDHDALVQMYLAEGLSYEEAVQAAQSATNLPWDTLKKAEGGRAEFIYGGSAGLRALLKRLKGKNKRVFPPPPQGIKRFMGQGDTDYIDNLKLQQLETILQAAKIDKDFIARIAKNKKMADPGLDFLMGKMDEIGMMPKNLSKYTDVDKDIMDIEMMIKNYSDKKLKRKPHNLGGRVSYSGGGRAGLPAITYGTPQMNMQGPQMPAGPQPAGIPGGTIVAQNQMQQNPWMGSQMQQGIGGMPRPQPGGMPRPQPGGMPRPMAAEGGRIGFGLGGINKGRRAFMKLLAALGIGTATIGTGLLKLGKAAKIAPKVTETIVQSNAAGMPAWFPSLVKRVINEGEDITKTAGTIERQTVHRSKLPESGTPIEVTRDLVTDDIIVDIGIGKHGFSAGHLGQPIRMELKKGEWIEPSIEGGGYMTRGGENVYPGMSKGFSESVETGGKSGKGVKSRDEFTIEEAEFTGGHPENIKFEETTLNKYGEQGSDLTEVESYATVKLDKKGNALDIYGKKSPKEMSGLSSGRSHGWRTKKGKSQAMAEGRAESRADEWQPDWDDSLPDDYASGGLAHMLGE